MKQIIIVLLGIILLTTGCTKTYNSIEDYSADMNTVKSNYESYKIDVESTTNYNTKYYKLYLKGNKWKIEEFSEKDIPIMTSVFTGDEIITYNADSDIALSLSDFHIFKNDKERRFYNPYSHIFFLIYWNDLNNKNLQIINNNETKNGYKCRMITDGNVSEFCVSDKYGIAVYERVKNNNYESVKNVINISNEDIPDTEFMLPDGIKKTTFSETITTIEEFDKEMKNIQKTIFSETINDINKMFENIKNISR